MASKELHFAKFINIHVHHFKQPLDAHCAIFAIENLSLKNNESKGFFSIGIHPWEIENSKNLDIKKIRELAAKESCLFVGETGLDYFRNIDHQTQIALFKEHILISEDFKKPLIIHCVKAMDEILNIHNNIKPKMPWIIHDFNASLHQIERAMQKEIYFSLGPTYLRSNSKIHHFAKHLDINKIFFESDDLPIEDVLMVYQKYSKQLNIPLDKLKIKIIENFELLIK